MATADIGQKLLTAEEFAELTDIEGPCELVEGEIEMLPPAGFGHGDISNTIGRLVGNYVAKHDLGRVLNNDSGVITKRGPDSVRGPDVAFYSYQVVAKGKDNRPKTYADKPPELVFEVNSPSDRWADIETKVAEYLRVGVQIVVVVDPKSETAIVHYADKPPVTIKPADRLPLEDVLGDFSVTLAELLE